LKKDESSSGDGDDGDSGGGGILPAWVVPHLCHGSTQSDDAKSRKRTFTE
jgi:hypothetical protein